ncbi:TonB-dependent receptor [Flavobacteriaceae bacterium]|nr:TonB-dependent receptor [Flavobacteriaceae bacterium]MDC1459491.1 TonB-dependent receptor [Flavobacteriaceae bacterium]MDC3221105.1 TonB-dependent receptor [Flavobacteriaceae bacterium]
MKKVFTLLIFLISNFSVSQDQTTDLDEVVVLSSKLDLPFSKNFRTVNIISSEDIKNSPVTNVSDLLQEITGIDVRRRGVGGVQGDLYIRGGGFDQTLLLVDGMKMDDAQTGHHTLNMILPLYLIERVEIIKGPAARIFGQNAFNGAINIVTKDFEGKKGTVHMNLNELSYGSFEQKNISLSTKITGENIKSLISYSGNRSDGYRHNTDYKRNNYFIKTSFNTNKTPVNIITSFNENKFGANGFYASPSATEQYEETQASLLGITTTINSEKLSITPRLYWRRGQDEYIYIRNNPSVYRNLHKTNKVSAELSGYYFSESGVTGFGVDLSTVNISSNNLGEHKRTTVNLFADYTFKLFDEKLFISPGIALSYFSDMSFHSFPGIDLGYNVSSDFKIYSNIGKTYRIPTYTDLYYSDRTTVGNENLNPESATSTELGLKYNSSNFKFSAALFNRNAKNIIDYVKVSENDLWKAENIGSLTTKGFEFDISYSFKSTYSLSNVNSISLGYTNINDDNYVSDINFSRYSLNSLKHHLISKLNLSYLKNINHSIVYKYAERSDKSNYSVLDSKIMYKKGLYIYINNILDEIYSETNLVPMPGRSFLVGFNVGID